MHPDYRAPIEPRCFDQSHISPTLSNIMHGFTSIMYSKVTIPDVILIFHAVDLFLELRLGYSSSQLIQKHLAILL